MSSAMLPEPSDSTPPRLHSLFTLLRKVLPFNSALQRFISCWFEETSPRWMKLDAPYGQNLRALVTNEEPDDILLALKSDGNSAKQLRDVLGDNPELLAPAPPASGKGQSLLRRAYQLAKEIPTAASLRDFLETTLPLPDAVLDFAAVCFKPVYQNAFSGPIALTRDQCIDHLLKLPTPLVLGQLREYLPPEMFKTHEKLLIPAALGTFPKVLALMATAVVLFKEKLQESWVELKERLGITGLVSAVVTPILAVVGYRALAAGEQQLGGGAAARWFLVSLACGVLLLSTWVWRRRKAARADAEAARQKRKQALREKAARERAQALAEDGTAAVADEALVEHTPPEARAGSGDQVVMQLRDADSQARPLRDAGSQSMPPPDAGSQAMQLRDADSQARPPRDADSQAKLEVHLEPTSPLGREPRWWGAAPAGRLGRVLWGGAACLLVAVVAAFYARARPEQKPPPPPPGRPQLPSNCTADWWCRQEPAAGAPTVERLRRIHGSGSSDVWFVGDPGVLLHFDGRSLIPVPAPLLPQKTPALLAKGDTIWIGGNAGTLLRRKGDSWAREPVGGQPPSAVAVVGEIGIAGPLDRARVQALIFAHREEIAACYLPHMPDDPTDLRDITLAVQLQGDGSVSSVSAETSALKSEEADSCIRAAVKGWRFPSVDGRASQVSVTFGLQGSKGEPSLDGAFIRAFATAGSDLWAVGSLGLILRRTEERWLLVPSGTRRTLYALWSAGPAELWAAGEHGTLLHYSGGEWRMVPAGTKKDLFALWGSDARDVFAAGEAGFVLRYDGSSWREQGNPSSNAVYGAWGSGPRDLWLVGQKGSVVHWDGRSLEQQRSGLEGELIDLFDVWGTGPADVWAAGRAGVVVRHVGSAGVVSTVAASR